MKNHSLQRLFITLTVALCPILSPHAETYVYEGFNYSGNLIPPGGGISLAGGGTGWSGSWYCDIFVGGFPVIPTSLLLPAAVIPPTGGSIRQTLDSVFQGYHAARRFAPLSIAPGASLWFSAIVSTTAVPDTRTKIEYVFNAPGDPQISFGTHGDAGGPLYWSFDGDAVHSPAKAIAPGTATLLVAEMHRDPVLAKFTFKYWINPGPATGPDGMPPEPPVYIPDPRIGDMSSLDKIVLVVGGSAGTHGFDELRIGSTYADINAYAPVIITCPAPATVECPAEAPAAATDLASFVAQGGIASGGCGTLTLTHVGDVPSGACPKTITRTYRATDTCGASVDRTQIITVQDTIRPVIITPVEPALTLECGMPLTTAPTAMDDCDPHPVIEKSFGDQIHNDPACPNSYFQTVTWRARDACGNLSDPVSQTIRVHDTLPPYATTAPGSLDQTVEAGDGAAIAATASPPPFFYDDCQGPVTPSAPTLRLVPDAMNCTGAALERRWHAVDACGNTSADFVQRITFRDTHGPSLTCPPDQMEMVISGAGGKVVTFSATATDPGDPSPDITFTPPSGSPFPMGTTPVTCRATDRCGNWSECTFTVTVTALGCTAASQQAYVKASNTGAGDQFGNSVAIDGDTMVVGAPGEAGYGAAYVFVRDSLGVWTQQAYLKASNSDRDFFGWSVAISNNTVVVGAPFESSNATGVNGDEADNSAPLSGAAYVFVRSGSTWNQQAYLKASNIGAGDLFGWSVAISGDTVVVGAPSEDSNAIGFNGPDNNLTADSGAAYVFVRSGVTWVQHAYLKASNPGVQDAFGESVAVSGGTVVVGAPWEDSNATKVDGPDNDLALNAGAAYVFTRSGATWSQQAYLKASNTESGDLFGLSVAISGDTVVVGTPGEDSDARGVTRGSPHETDNSADGAGAAYVFARIGSSWNQQAYVKASKTEAGDSFGSSVAISGNTLVVGGSLVTLTIGDGFYSFAGRLDVGAASVFVRNGDAWSKQPYLKASNTEAQDFFGRSVAVSGDTAVIGAHWESSNFRGVQNTSAITPEQADNSADRSGAAYLFLLADEPCALDDIFSIPTDAPLVIPVGALLGNDAHSRGRPNLFKDSDATTVRGTPITSVGSPVTALKIPGIPWVPGTEDTFTYRITDGTREATGTVHLRLVAAPGSQLNTIRTLSPPTLLPMGSGGLTLVFNPPAPDTYALERKTFLAGSPGSVEGVWTEVARQATPAPNAITFVDGLMPNPNWGAVYRVRTAPPVLVNP